MGKQKCTALLARAIAMRVASAEGRSWESLSGPVRGGMMHSAGKFIGAYLDHVSGRDGVDNSGRLGARFDYGLSQRAEGWRAVCRALNKAAPGWILKEGTGIECAERAIAALAAQGQGEAVACPHHVRYPHPCRECEDAKPADSGLVGDAEVTRACNAYFDALPPSGGVAADREAMRAAIAALAAQGHGDAVAKVRHFDYCGIARNGFSQEAEMLDVAPVLPDGTLLYTRLAPPASPAGMPDGWDSVVSDALAILKDVAQFHGQLPVGMYQHIQPRLAALLTATPSAPSTDAEVSHD